MTLSHKRLATALAATIFWGLVALWIWNSRGGEQATVKLVDVGATASRLLEERARQGATARTLVRQPIPLEIARELMPALKGSGRMRYDPLTHFWAGPGFEARLKFEEHPDGGWDVVTNQLGFREQDEVRVERPDLRILVTGDSHTEGVVATDESFSNLLEQMLRERAPDRTVEVLNGGLGAFNFYNYVGVLEKFLSLEPDVFVLSVYGGNDFKESLLLHRYFQRLTPPPPPTVEWAVRWKEAVAADLALIAQSYSQLLAFQNDPSEPPLALEAARLVTEEIQRICAERGIRFICVLIPAMTDVQPQLIQPRIDRLRDLFGLAPADLEINDRISEHYLKILEQLGLKCVDMRPIYRAEAESVFWFTDLHINRLGHQRIAEALLPLVEDLL